MPSAPVRRSAEQLAHLSSGIDICFQTFGDDGDPALLLVMGLAGPLIWWDEELCSLLAERRFFVIRYDNRDVGRSTKLPGGSVRRIGTISAALRGTRSRPPYTMSDMAGDAVGLLDHLGVQRAHVVGVSMGGMIAQTLTIEHPSRVLSLVSIMSTTGGRRVGWQDPRLLPMLLRNRGSDKESYVRQSMVVSRMIGSPGYPSLGEAEERALAGATYDRGLSPEGVVRQMQAILAQPNRARRLRDVAVPVLVIHGTADKMVHVSGGRATAQATPGAELLLIPGMGHDLPREVWPAIVDGIERTAHRAAPR